MREEWGGAAIWKKQAEVMDIGTQYFKSIMVDMKASQVPWPPPWHAAHPMQCMHVARCAIRMGLCRPSPWGDSHCNPINWVHIGRQDFDFHRLPSSTVGELNPMCTGVLRSRGWRPSTCSARRPCCRG